MDLMRHYSFTLFAVELGDEVFTGSVFANCPAGVWVQINPLYPLWMYPHRPEPFPAKVAYPAMSAMLSGVPAPLTNGQFGAIISAASRSFVSDCHTAPVLNVCL